MSGNDFVEQFAAAVAKKLAEKQPRLYERRVFGVEEAAKYLGISAEGVRHLVAAGDLPRIDLDRKFRFDVEDLDKLIARKRVAA